MSQCPIEKFLSDCSDLNKYVDNVEEKLKLLELEVGILLRRPITQGDGPSDASLQVLQEARGIKKSLNAEISESSEMAKNMGHLLKELMEKVKVSYKQTEELEKYMEDYGYEIPPPLDPILFDIFRDSVQSSNATASELSHSHQEDKGEDEHEEDDGVQQDQDEVVEDKQEADGEDDDNDDENGEEEEIDSENEILDRTEDNADLEATETKLKPNSKDRYQFQTSVLNTPLQSFHFSKKTINFQNSYLFTSPTTNDITKTALLFKQTNSEHTDQYLDSQETENLRRIEIVSSASDSHSSQPQKNSNPSTGFQPTSILKPPTDFDYLMPGSAKKDWDNLPSLNKEKSPSVLVEKTRNIPQIALKTTGETSAQAPTTPSRSLKPEMTSTSSSSSTSTSSSTSKSSSTITMSSLRSTYSFTKARSQGPNILTATLDSIRTSNKAAGSSKTAPDGAKTADGSAKIAADTKQSNVLEDITDKHVPGMESRVNQLGDDFEQENKVESTAKIPDHVGQFLAQLTASTKKQKENLRSAAVIEHDLTNKEGDVRARPRFMANQNVKVLHSDVRQSTAENSHKEDTKKAATPDNVREFLRNLGSR